MPLRVYAGIHTGKYESGNDVLSAFLKQQVEIVSGTGGLWFHQRR